MQYKFPYIHGSPMIMARLRKSGGVARFFEFLVDTGADYTLISKYNAQLLGIFYKRIKQKELKVEAANRSIIYTKRITLIITIENHDLTIPVLIAKEDVDSLIGRAGVFDYFDILFQEQKQQIIFNKN